MEDIKIITNLGDITEEEKSSYMKIVQEKNGGTLEGVTKIIINSTENSDSVNLSYETRQPFERIRRVTGYLSKVENWNDGKRAELQDRVKHA